MDKELSKGFTGIEINGVRFSNISEMLQYMDKQREQLLKARQIIEMVTAWQLRCGNGHPTFYLSIGKNLNECIEAGKAVLKEVM